MNGRMDVSIPASTRERVLEAAKSLRYRPNSLARSLVRGRTQTIGLMLPCLGSDFHGQIVDGIRTALLEEGYNLLIVDTGAEPEHEAGQANFLLEHRVEGLFCIAGARTAIEMPKWLKDLAMENVPCVVIDDHRHGDQVDCVVSDDAHGIELAMAHLVEHRHTRIAYMNRSPSPLSNTGYGERRTAFYEKLGKFGLRNLYGDITARADGIEHLTVALDPQFQRADRPTAIIADNDYWLADIYEYAAGRGLSIPADLAVIGFGNQLVSQILKLTSVSQEARQMGRTAAKQLLSRINQSVFEPVTIYTPTRLELRQSA